MPKNSRRPRESGDPGATVAALWPWIPAFAGTIKSTKFLKVIASLLVDLLQDELIVKVTPLRIVLLNQFQFPGAPPILDPLLPRDRILHGFVKLREHQCTDAVMP
jgi:hypothetical protein